MPVITKIKYKGTNYDITAQGLQDVLAQCAGYANEANEAAIEVTEFLNMSLSGKANTVHMHQATDIYDLATAVTICQNAAQVVHIILGEIDTFNPSTFYEANTLVLHDISQTAGTEDIRIFRATATHEAGTPWDDDDWEQVSFMSIIAGILDTQYEHVVVRYESSDGQLRVNNRQVTVTPYSATEVDDDNIASEQAVTYVTDENGEVSFRIRKGTRYSVNVEQPGPPYTGIQPKMYKATLNDRVSVFRFEAHATSETLNVVAYAANYEPNSSINVYEVLSGKTVTITYTDGSGSMSRQFNARLACSFENIPFGKEYIISYPAVAGVFIAPSNSQPIVASFATRTVYPSYYYFGDAMYVVTTGGTAYNFLQLTDAINNGTVTSADTALLKLTNSTLAQNNADVFVRFSDLRGSGRPSGAWLNQNVWLETGTSTAPSSGYTIPTSTSTGGLRSFTRPDGVIGDWDYQYNTNTMRALSAQHNMSSAAANNAYSAKTTIDGVELHGWLPTALQWEQFAVLHEAISKWTQLIYGINCPWGPGYGGNWWSSSQYNAPGAWYLGNGNLNYYVKNFSLSVLPVFDFSPASGGGGSTPTP